jgi:small subunit ribosomal protein S16
MPTTEEVITSTVAVRIRLRRMGTTKKPFYRIVVADSRAPRDGRFIAALGNYNPREKPVTVKIDEDKALAWLAKGARPSAVVERLFRNIGLWKRWNAAKEQRTRAAVPGSPA